ncbi:hypothetical protein QWY75_12730 [Pontixanthobacter aestiaquae]|uniref:DUF3617 family protein n=1 Tax=Pontixanthobacter aestiaquae TaxID=1509367 RepID=A0A844Z3N5_9SPHN|nr:DUF3617 family protein [Pontixanthobacter aestiaquae]MDN3647070.1 hypothetical protein [Pontixanthobacter aestiaquae]MXO81952.1 hypothetical protein [Pontixanthobacter aestiaquae]
MADLSPFKARAAGLLRRIGTFAALCAAAWGIGIPATAQAPSLAMLDGLDRGLWEVRYRTVDETKKICVRTGHELIQLRHPGPRCAWTTVSDGPAAVTVHYTCRGKGYGQTTIRKETSALVQIAGNATVGREVYNVAAEARRVGRCTG